jgi:hypothetical protein
MGPIAVLNPARIWTLFYANSFHSEYSIGIYLVSILI